MSKYLIMAAAIIAVATMQGAAQAHTSEAIEGPAPAAQAAGEIQVAAMNAYGYLKGQKSGSAKGAAVPATPATSDVRKKSRRGRDGLVIEE